MIRNYVIGLGSNLGSRHNFLLAAVELIRATNGLRISAVSSVYKSEAMGPPQPPYLNGAVLAQTDYPPLPLLKILHLIETQLARERRERWGARTIDLDLLWTDQGAVRTDELIIPHPGLVYRPFALAPLIEVAPELTDQYQNALVDLGGPPARVASLSLSPQPLSVSAQDSWIEATGIDRDDALAFAASALAVAATSCRPDERAPMEVRTIDCRSENGGETAAFIRAIIEETSSGFITSRAVVSSRQSGRVIGKLLGQSGPATAPISHLRILETLHPARTRIYWQTV
jgi:2-amino-4-hydroxy-6-hydroxymethyldihydropteridine diphosphokinase